VGCQQLVKQQKFPHVGGVLQALRPLEARDGGGGHRTDNCVGGSCTSTDRCQKEVSDVTAHSHWESVEEGTRGFHLIRL
jgi:hypothetical protein